MSDMFNFSKDEFCVKCGQKNPDTANFCKYCGNKLKTINKDDVHSDPIEAFKDSNDDFNEANWDNKDMINFIQKNSEYYIPKFKDIQDFDKSSSWNWASFFFGSYWFMYRKMYLLAFGLVIASFVLPMIPFVGPVCVLALPFVNGAYGNILYLKHINKKLEEANNIDNEDIKHRSILRNGGVNLILPIILAVVIPLLVYGLLFFFAFIGTMFYYPYY